MLRGGHHAETEIAGKTEGRQEEDEADRARLDPSGGIPGLPEYREGRGGLGIGLSCYLHIPFCRSKCRYCAFYSRAARGEEIEFFLEALKWELETWDKRLQGKPQIDTLYIGGGTPTCLSPGQWERLRGVLEEGLSFTKDIEISVEANPESLEKGHLRQWRDWGVRRVSLGIQSFSDPLLRWLGRIHDGRQASRALQACREWGFRVSGDLMFGIPGQEIRDWHKDLHLLASLAGHVSIYQLTAEPGTALEGEALPTQGAGYPFYRFSQWYLGSKGFTQYEVASFAQKGQWCLHNLAYWKQANVLGLGPGAWGYFDGVRYSNAADIEAYMAKEPKCLFSWTERLSAEERAREAAILALRTCWGIRWNLFRRKYGLEATRLIHDTLESLPSSLFIRKRGSTSFSSRGFRVANEVWERLV